MMGSCKKEQFAKGEKGGQRNEQKDRKEEKSEI